MFCSDPWADETSLFKFDVGRINARRFSSQSSRHCPNQTRVVNDPHKRICYRSHDGSCLEKYSHYFVCLSAWFRLPISWCLVYFLPLLKMLHGVRQLMHGWYTSGFCTHDQSKQVTWIIPWTNSLTFLQFRVCIHKFLIAALNIYIFLQSKSRWDDLWCYTVHYHRSTNFHITCKLHRNAPEWNVRH